MVEKETRWGPLFKKHAKKKITWAFAYELQEQFICLGGWMLMPIFWQGVQKQKKPNNREGKNEMKGKTIKK